jgi:aryl-alcohol dehydrogenase-like predicted oxidoreductase
MRRARISKRRYKDEVKLSILGLGGMVLVDLDRKSADSVVAEAFERGVNYFDVAPFYGNGEAEKSMGIALAPYRNRVFLACKTLERSASGALSELDESLRRLRTDFIDLYQFHAVSDEDEVEEIFAPGGACEAFLLARQKGKIRYIGFSAHTVEAALSMLERFPFDSILFPVNFVCCERGHFGPQVLEKARNLGVARLAIKAMAHGPWRKNEKRIYPNCWYRPIDDRDLARQALRYTLSQNVTAAIPPGDIRLFRMALDMADDLPPLNTQEYGELTATASNLRPLLST